MNPSTKTLVAIFAVALIFLSGCTQPQAPQGEQVKTELPEEPQAPAYEEPSAAPSRPTPAPAPVPSAPSGVITAPDIVNTGETLLTHQPTKEIPVDTAGKEMAVGAYKGTTSQTTSNKNAGYWDCIKSKVSTFKDEAPDTPFDQQLVAANRACIGYNGA